MRRTIATARAARARASASGNCHKSCRLCWLPAMHRQLVRNSARWHRLVPSAKHAARSHAAASGRATRTQTTAVAACRIRLPRSTRGDPSDRTVLARRILSTARRQLMLPRGRSAFITPIPSDRTPTRKPSRSTPQADFTPARSNPARCSRREFSFCGFSASSPRSAVARAIRAVPLHEGHARARPRHDRAAAIAIPRRLRHAGDR